MGLQKNNELSNYNYKTCEIKIAADPTNWDLKNYICINLSIYLCMHVWMYVQYVYMYVCSCIYFILIFHLILF